MIIETARLRLEPMDLSQLSGLCRLSGDERLMRHITGCPRHG